MNPILREILIFIGIVGSAIAYMIFLGTPDTGVKLLIFIYPFFLLIRWLIWSRKKPLLREILIFLCIVAMPVVYIIFTDDFGLGLFFLFYSYPAYLLIRLLIWSIKASIWFVKFVKSMKSPILNKIILTIGVSIATAVLIYAGTLYKTSLEFAKGPTAIVIDAVNDKPIEGTVALAQWYSAAPGGLFEGGIDNLAKAAEAFSDKDGIVHIDGFWGLYIFSGKPRLTIYKPGYVLWDSRRVCPRFEPQTGFDENNRTIKLVRFDSEARKWPALYPWWKTGPHEMQASFFMDCYSGQMGIKYQHNEIKFQEIFYKYEQPFMNKEAMEARENRNAKN